MSSLVEVPFILDFTGEGVTITYGDSFDTVVSISLSYLEAIQYSHNASLTAGSLSLSSSSSSGGYTSFVFSDGATISVTDEIALILEYLATGAYVGSTNESSSTDANDDENEDASEFFTQLSRELTRVGLYKPSVTSSNCVSMLKLLCSRYRAKLQLA